MFATDKDYYAILGVTEDASADAIKKAYRKLARQYHPDKNPGKTGAEDRFKEIQEAYDVLGSQEERKKYDRFRKNPYAYQDGTFDAGDGSRSGYYRTPDGTYVRFESSNDSPFSDTSGGGFGGLGDLFEQFFERSQEPRAERRSRQARAADIESVLRLSFDEALRGGKREVTLPGGETVRLDVPEGVDAGFKIRLKGRGEAGPRGVRGDLYIKFEVTPHPRFERKGNDVQVVETIDMVDAAIGANRAITDPYGRTVKMTIPAGTQPGRILRLRGQGIKTAKERGDLLVKVNVQVPKKLSDEAREALKKWNDTYGGS